MNLNCALKIQIHEGTFLKDMDTFGKQDPFAQFFYDQEKMKTKVIDGGGKHAVWNEEFVLQNVRQQIRLKQEFKLETYDEDTVTDDKIGNSHPFTLNRLCQDENPKDFDLELYDENYHLAGNAKITTTYIQKPLDPIPTNVKEGCTLEMSIL